MVLTALMLLASEASAQQCEKEGYVPEGDCSASDRDAEGCCPSEALWAQWAEADRSRALQLEAERQAALQLEAERQATLQLEADQQEAARQDKAFSDARNTNTLDSWSALLEQYPDHPRRSVAESAIAVIRQRNAERREAEWRRVAIQKAAEAYHDQMVEVPAGTYSVGCTPGQERACDEDERPAHDVVLTRPYSVGLTEITQELYEMITGRNPSAFAECGLGCPVEQVSWYDAVKFANALSARLGLTECYAIRGEDVTLPGGLHCGGFRLPTEAEWEIAARGGEDLMYSGSDSIDATSWYGGNSESKTHPVGQKEANGYGLYDMTGGVWEWVWDKYAGYPTKASTDPKGMIGQGRVARGGSWINYDGRTRVSFRYWTEPSSRDSFQGFRLVLSTPPPT